MKGRFHGIPTSYYSLEFALSIFLLAALRAVCIGAAWLLPLSLFGHASDMRSLPPLMSVPLVLVRILSSARSTSHELSVGLPCQSGMCVSESSEETAFFLHFYPSRKINPNGLAAKAVDLGDDYYALTHYLLALNSQRNGRYTNFNIQSRSCHSPPRHTGL